MILLDVNLLVYAHRRDVPNHSAYRDWLEQHLRREIKPASLQPSRPNS